MVRPSTEIPSASASGLLTLRALDRGHRRTADPRRFVELERLDQIAEYKFLVHPRIAGRGPTLYQGGLPSTRRLELVSAKPLRCGAVAVHYTAR